jgi:transcriptional regulator with XRE-family HTH domain
MTARASGATEERMLAVGTDHRRSEEPAPVGERIRAAREAKGWSQAELAAGLGVTVTTISRWERGTAVPQRSVLRTLSRALDCSPELSSDPVSTPRPARRRRASIEAASIRIARGLAEITAALRDAR